MDTTLPRDQRATERVNEIAAGINGVQTAVTTFDTIAAGLAQIAAAHPTDVIVGDIQTTKGMQRAIEARAAWREPRLRVERIRKEAKQPVLELGRAIDAFAADLTEKLRVGEDHYDAQIKAEEKRKAEEKAAREAAERVRVERLHARVMFIRNLPGDARQMNAAGIHALITKLDQLPIGSDFEEFEAQARVEKDETLGALQQMLVQQVEREAEEARLKAEREEQARQAAELAEQRRQLAEQQAALELQQREAAEALARQQQELERERTALIEQQQRTLDAAEDAAPGPKLFSGTDPAFPGTTDERTIDELDAHIKAESARSVAEALAAEPPTLTLGKIAERLGFPLSRGVLDSLGFAPAGRDRAAVLYHEADWPAICAALIKRIEQAAQA